MGIEHGSNLPTLPQQEHPFWELERRQLREERPELSDVEIDAIVEQAKLLDAKIGQIVDKHDRTWRSKLAEESKTDN